MNYKEYSFEKIIELLKANKMYNEKRKREPIRPNMSKLDIVDKIRKQVAYDATLKYINSFREFQDIKEFCAYNLTSYNIDYFVFQRNIIEIPRKLSTKSEDFACYFLPNTIVDKKHFDCAVVKYNNTNEISLFLNICITVNHTKDCNSRQNNLEFAGGIIRYRAMNYKVDANLISNPSDFLKLLTKYEDINLNITELEYYINSKVFRKILEIKDDKIVFPEF